MRKPVTYEDLEALPANVVGEILAGDLYAHPRPARRHTRASSILGADLTVSFDRGRGGPGGWVILVEPELHLKKDVLVPDLAGWRRDRAPVTDDSAFYDTAPDWLCETISPSTSRVDRTVKLPIYFREGVQSLWLVDPNAQTLEVFSRQPAGWLLTHTFAGEAAVRAPPFDAVELELGALWR